MINFLLTLYANHKTLKKKNVFTFSFVDQMDKQTESIGVFYTRNIGSSSAFNE